MSNSMLGVFSHKTKSLYSGLTATQMLLGFYGNLDAEDPTVDAAQIAVYNTKMLLVHTLEAVRGYKFYVDQISTIDELIDEIEKCETPATRLRGVYTVIERQHIGALPPSHRPPRDEEHGIAFPFKSTTIDTIEALCGQIRELLSPVLHALQTYARREADSQAAIVSAAVSAALAATGVKQAHAQAQAKAKAHAQAQAHAHGGPPPSRDTQIIIKERSPNHAESSERGAASGSGSNSYSRRQYERSEEHHARRTHQIHHPVSNTSHPPHTPHTPHTPHIQNQHRLHTPQLLPSRAHDYSKTTTHPDDDLYSAS